jgi:hypothetical protein
MQLLKVLGAGLVFAIGMAGGTSRLSAQVQDHPLASTTAEWWQYAISIPTSVNPLVDPNGANCMVGQHDPIWFLSGIFPGGTVRRKCTIPANEWLFFPVINSVQINTPGVCGQAGSVGVATLRALAAPLIDGVTTLSVKVDGKVVTDLMRIKSDVFATTIPADSIFNGLCGGPGTVPPGVYSPSVDDGYYALVAPLKVGNHTLHILAEVPGQNFVQDVTYKLVVTSVESK